MSHSTDYLLQMVKQISANQPRDFDDETNAERVAAHLRRFWAPSMLAQARKLPTEDLDPVSAKALQLLQATS